MTDDGGRGNEHDLHEGIRLDEAADVLNIMSNKVRLRILIRTIDREWSVGELADDIGVSQSALSQHLAKLRESRLVRVRAESQLRYYRCESELVSRLITQLKL